MKNKKIILLIIGILLGISALVGVSYAYYIKSHNQEESNVVKTKCLNFSLTNEKNDINLDKQYPIQDTEGRNLHLINLLLLILVNNLLVIMLI